MKLFRSIFVSLGLAAAAFGLAAPASAQSLDPQNTLLLDTPHGRVTIRLRPDLAPKHVEQIKTLVRRKFYDGAPFHRVIEGFMAQTGDPRNRNGTGGSDLPNIPAEFSREPYRRGTVGMARTNDPNSANSQFFICFNDSGCASLTGQYTIWGNVVSGMDAIDKIKRGAPGSGSVSGPENIIRMQLAADAR